MGNLKMKKITIFIDHYGAEEDLVFARKLKIYIRHVLTLKEYDKDTWKEE
jgi:mRNA-degrading endonuclease HigB of HigAB toxin-antitoxin module